MTHGTGRWLLRADLRRAAPYALLVVAALASLSSAAIAADSDEVAARAQQIVLDWNRRDFHAFAADMTEQPDIIDEFPPFHWFGPSAISVWNHDFEADAAKNAVTDATMTVSKPSNIVVNGSNAYVVLPSVVHFKQAGQPGTEPGTLTMSMEKFGSRWVVSALSWAKT
jgi:hypothetical protein